MAHQSLTDIVEIAPVGELPVETDGPVSLTASRQTEEGERVGLLALMRASMKRPADKRPNFFLHLVFFIILKYTI